MENIHPAVDREAWRGLLARLGDADASFLPEYHLAYSLRVKGSEPLLWSYEEGGDLLVYPILLTPVRIDGRETPYRDVSSIYGFTGPLGTSTRPEFLAAAWRAFDGFAAARNIVAEFVRFSPFNRTERFAHPGAQVEVNRTLAVTRLPDTEEALLDRLGPKTRNMLRKAQRAGLAARELPVGEHLAAFRALYDETMRRNQASSFFWYDDDYYGRLLLLGRDGLRLFGVFAGDRLVAAAMTVVNGKSALYHLGASLTDSARQGAGNLALFQMSSSLLRSGVSFINLTGGRTLLPDDPLLLFKKSNATDTAPFHIGKRVIDRPAYDGLRDAWREQHGAPPDAEKILFWRP